MIVIRLLKEDKALIMNVLEQDESLRRENETDNRKAIFNNGEMELVSYAYPQLCEDRVYLRGTEKDMDIDTSSLVFSSIEERDQYYDMYLRLFSDYNNRDLEDIDSFNKDIPRIILV